MSFNIDNFKSVLDKHGGLARLNLFDVRFGGPSAPNTFVPWLTPEFDNNDLRFFCQTVTLPGMSVDVFNYRPNNIDVAQSIPYAIGHQQLECVFMIDDNYRVLSYFHKWMRRVSNYALTGGQNRIPAANDHQVYELGYKKEYAQRMTIVAYSKSPKKTSTATTLDYTGYAIVLTDVYPVQIGTVNMSWNANDEYGTLPVSFSYGSMDVAPITEGLTFSIPPTD